MIARLIAVTALLTAATALALLIAFMAATDARLKEMEGPMPAWNGPAERRA